MALRTGEYRHRMIIQKRAEKRDAAGEPVRSYSQHAIRWGKRMPKSGTEGMEPDAAALSRVMETFRIHHTRGVDPMMRILAPGAVTTLATGVSATGGTTVKVADVTGFPLSGAYCARIGSELVEVTAGQGTTTWTVTRAVDGTALAAATTGAAVQHMRAYNIQAAWEDWRFGAETVIEAERVDGGA